MLRAVPLILGTSVLVGCQAAIHPPAEVSDPVTVFVANYGTHASLILPREEPNRWVELTYGQWDWYVDGDDAWYDVLGALLIPQQGALGKRELNGPVRENVARPSELEEMLELRVERSAVHELIDRVDRVWYRSPEPPISKPERGMEFVHDPESYWVFNHCASRVTEWLIELGCRVDGDPILVDFVLLPPEGNGPRKPDTREARSAHPER